MVESIKFDIQIFNYKKWYNPDEYYLLLANQAMKANLLTANEFKNYTAKFLKMRGSYPHMTIGKTIQMLETIIKSRYERQINVNVTKAQSDDKFLDDVINYKPKKKSK